MAVPAESVCPWLGWAGAGPQWERSIREPDEPENQWVTVQFLQQELCLMHLSWYLTNNLEKSLTVHLCVFHSSTACPIILVPDHYTNLNLYISKRDLDLWAGCFAFVVSFFFNALKHIKIKKQFQSKPNFYCSLQSQWLLEPMDFTVLAYCLQQEWLTSRKNKYTWERKFPLSVKSF